MGAWGSVRGVGKWGGFCTVGLDPPGFAVQVQVQVQHVQADNLSLAGSRGWAAGGRQQDGELTTILASSFHC